MNYLMKISLRAYLSFFVMLSFIIIFIYHKHSPNTVFYTNTQPVIEHALQGIKAKRFDSEGNLLQELRMNTWLRYQHDLTSHLKAPNLTIYYPNGEVWGIVAQQGQSFQQQINGKLEKLQLSENVAVKRLNKANNSWYELKTQNMLFYPHQSTATTEDNVLVTGNGMKIQAKGMHANLKDHTIEFLKNVKTYYVVP
ncbi:MAG: LPS export ABC transporter periplasmic protein LptC [Proteobacteria bacterium]|nr:LPS export ABC transporter periplasmic protein LptC [Pseudomonadota bacterium]